MTLLLNNIINNKYLLKIVLEYVNSDLIYSEELLTQTNNIYRSLYSNWYCSNFIKNHIYVVS